MKIFLASLSPRRLLLLRCLGHDVVVIDPKVIECVDQSLNAFDISLENAQRKARSVFNAEEDFLKESSSLIIGADTVVTRNDRVFLKPLDHDDAINMLEMLSGGFHQVVTSYCVKTARDEISRSVQSEVEFRALTRREITAYLACGEWVDKAGAYAVQGLGAALCRQVKGSITNVIGLPVEEFMSDAKKLIRG